MLPIRDNQSSGIFPVIIITIIAINAYAFFLELTAPNINILLRDWALIPILIDFSDITTLYSLVTSIFLHGGFFHFISNMWFLWIFGDNVEADLGKFRFILFYLAGGVIASLVQLAFIRDSFIPVLGASGAIAAVLGFYFVRFPHHKIKSLVFLFYIFVAELPARVVLGLWFITQIFNGAAGFAIQTSAEGGVAWWAHVGGFLFGYLVGKRSQFTLAKDEFPNTVLEGKLV